MSDKYHITSIRNGGLYGHSLHGCDEAGCAGSELYLGPAVDGVEAHEVYSEAALKRAQKSAVSSAARALGALGGKVGGKAKTAAKTKAAQKNGKKGGRPVGSKDSKPRKAVAP